MIEVGLGKAENDVSAIKQKFVEKWFFSVNSSIYKIITLKAVKDVFVGWNESIYNGRILLM